MKQASILPWEREGYGFSGPTDALHDTKINNRLPDKKVPGLTDLGAAVVAVGDGKGHVKVIDLFDDTPVEASNLQVIRKQHPHLR